MLLRKSEYFKCFNIYVTKNMNTFNVLTIIQYVYADKKWIRICFDLLKVNKIY